MQINSSLSSLGNVLALITDLNPLFSAVTEAALGVVSTSAVTADAEGRNTVVVVTAVGYQNSASFTYKRLGLTDSIAVAPAAISLTGTETADQVLSAVAAALNLVASELTISASWINADGSITVPTAAASGSVSTGLTVTSNSGSSLYVDGSTLALTVNFPSVPPVTQPDINTLVVATALSGFDVVTPPVVTPPATDGTSSTTGTPTPAPAPATDGTSSSTPAPAPAPATDGTSSTTGTPAPAPATDGTSAATPTPATDGTTAATPSPATDGTAPAASN